MCNMRSAVKPSKWENVAKESNKSITLEKIMELSRRMEDGQTHPNACRSMNLWPSAVSTIMKNEDKIEQSMQHATTVSAIPVRNGRSKLLGKTEKLLSLWADDLNEKTFC